MDKKYKLQEIRSNVEPDKVTEKYIKKTMSFLAKCLSKSLGPFGSTTVIEDRMLNHTITKDGYTILKNIRLIDETPSIILDMLKNISRNQVRTVGDGTTSSIIISEALYEELTELKNYYVIPPKIISDSIKYAYEIISSYIKSLSKELTPEMEELNYIASIASNNDYISGEIIQNIFREIGKYGIVTLEKSPQSETYYEIKNGMELNRGVTNLLMLNNRNEKLAEYNQPVVCMIDEKIDENDLSFLAELLGEFCLRLKHPLILIAPSFTTAFDTFVQANLVNNKDLPFVAVPLNNKSAYGKEKFEDLACFLGCTIIRKSEGEIYDYENVLEKYNSYMGTCKTFKASETYAQFIEGSGDPQKISERISSIEEKIEDLKLQESSNLDLEDEIFKLRKRMAGLKKSMAILYAGGNTESEKETNKYLLEDAVCACKSALEYGYVVGGNLIVPYILSQDEYCKTIINYIQSRIKETSFKNENSEIPKEINEYIKQIPETLRDTFLSSYITVLNNYFNDLEVSTKQAYTCLDSKKIVNLSNFELQDFENTEVINSAKTDIEILKSVSSIISLLVMSNQFILTNYSMQDHK